jgi:hypothetical protein
LRVVPDSISGGTPFLHLVRSRLHYAFFVDIDVSRILSLSLSLLLRQWLSFTNPIQA